MFEDLSYCPECLATPISDCTCPDQSSSAADVDQSDED